MDDPHVNATSAPVEAAPAPGAPRSLVALVSNLIDYAGLFPPAKLDMGPTATNYAGFLAGPDAWMLERLVVPVARFDELETASAELLPKGEDDEPWVITALTAPAGDDGFKADIARIAAFNKRHATPEHGRAIVDVIELRAPSASAVEKTLDHVPDELFPFFEIPAEPDPRGLIAALVGGDAGAKIRTGGVTADLYLQPDAVARFMAACAAADVAFKATAGMHHPLRHRSSANDAMEFGFLNVFTAAALALHRRASADTIVSVLTEERAEAFSFADDALTIGDHRLDVEEIEDARLSFAISFGSCSFDEPCGDLRRLGLLK